MCTVDNDLRCAVEVESDKLPMEMPGQNGTQRLGDCDVKDFVFRSGGDGRFIHFSHDSRELALSLVLTKWMNDMPGICCARQSHVSLKESLSSKVMTLYRLETTTSTRLDQGQRRIAESDKPCGRSDCPPAVLLDWFVAIDVCPEQREISTHQMDLRHTPSSHFPQLRDADSP